MTESNFKFFTEVSEPKFSNPLYNSSADELYLEVSGDFTSCTLNVYGLMGSPYKPEDRSNLTKLAGVNMSNFAVTTSIQGKGVYAYSITPFSTIVVEVAAVDGSIDVFGRTTR